MNDEQIRIIIANACPDSVEWHDETPYWRGLWSIVGEGQEYFAVFDPLNDLNAMREAEKTLEDKWEYIDQLVDITGAEWTDSYEEVFVIAHATARQRAEAFIATIIKKNNN